MRLTDAVLMGHVPAQDRDVRRLLDSGRYEEADIAFDKLLDAGQNFVDERWDRSTALLHRATLAWRLRRIPLALELAAEGWTELPQDPPATPGTAHTTGMLGYLMEMIGHHHASLELLRKSVQLAHDSGDMKALTHCLAREANAWLMQAVDREGRQARTYFATAAELYLQALSLPCEPQVRRTSLAGRARTLAGLGEPRKALPLAEEALALSTESEDVLSSALANWAMGAAHYVLGSFEQSRTFVSKALAMAESTRDALLQMRFSRDLADICAELRDPAGEAAALRQTVEISRAGIQMLREGLGQALEQRRVAIQAQRMAVAAQETAIRDSLTGLLNRLGLERRGPPLLERTIAQGRVPWLLMLDVDWFKNVNDAVGHSAGDTVLQEVAHILRRECRADDLVCRWAGDEFVILLLDATEEHKDAGPRVAERIREAVDSHDWQLLLGPRARQPTVSIGVAAGPADFKHLFAAADIVLYRAKQQGRNRVGIDFIDPAKDRPTIV